MTPQEMTTLTLRVAELKAENEALKQERDKLAEFVNWLIEEHDLEYQGVIANDT